MRIAMAFYLDDVKGLIFDPDETLLNTLEAYLTAFNTGLRRFGPGPVDKPRIARFLDGGMRLGDMLLTLSPEIFSPEDQLRMATR
jgi:phosphoglycolate phosphatase-like HAD superfamily hydrolase